MSKMKKYLLTGISYVLVAALAIGGTVAYLQDDDSDVNVMTLGDVYIEQIEQERDANGNLVEFTQDKPAYPAVGPIAWDNEQLEVNGGKYNVFSKDLKNVVDKIVTVNNTGKSDAYVRTVVAIEAPDYDPKNLIHISYNEIDVEQSNFVTVEIDGVEYVIIAYTYEKALAAGETSAPSLMQLFLDSSTTNEDCAAYGDTWEVLVLSQAVQAAGFADAETALDAGFGAFNEENAAKWFGGIEIPDGSTFVTTLDELKSIASASGHAKLGNDIYLDEAAVILNDGIINGNGNTISSSIQNEGVIDARGGTVKNAEITGVEKKVTIGRFTYTYYPSTGVITDEGILEADLFLDNVNIYDLQYALSLSNANGYGVYVTNSELANHVDISDQKEAIFTNCRFYTDEEANPDGTAFIGLGGDMTFVNCHFEAGIDFYERNPDSAGGTVEFINCTYGPSKIPVEAALAFFQNNMDYTFGGYSGTFGDGRPGVTKYSFVVDGTVVW